MSILNRAKEFAHNGWKFINSNLVSSMLAATAGHLLTKSYRDTEITELYDKNDKLLSENETLNAHLEHSTNTNTILRSKLSDRNHELQTCRLKSLAIMRDFEQSYCFWRSNNHRSIINDVAIGKELVDLENPPANPIKTR